MSNSFNFRCIQVTFQGVLLNMFVQPDEDELFIGDLDMLCEDLVQKIKEDE